MDGVAPRSTTLRPDRSTAGRFRTDSRRDTTTTTAAASHASFTNARAASCWAIWPMTTTSRAAGPAWAEASRGPCCPTRWPSPATTLRTSSSSSATTRSPTMPTATRHRCLAPYLKALRRSTAGPGHGSPTAFFVVAADSPRHSSPGINPFRRSHIFAVVSGMMVVSEDVAINGRASRSSWGHSRLSPVDETAGALGFPIGLLFAEHPIRRFGEMPGHGSDRLRVALPPGNALIETTHVAVARAPAVETDCVRGFDERPLEVAVDIGSRRSETGLPSARVNARCGTRIGSQLLGAGKPRDIAHLKGDYDGEREPHARQGQEPLNRRCRLEGGLNPLFERTHLAAQLLDLPEQLLAGVRRVRREELKSLPQKRAAPDAEKIAHL